MLERVSRVAISPCDRASRAVKEVLALARVPASFVALRAKSNSCSVKSAPSKECCQGQKIRV